MFEQISTDELKQRLDQGEKPVLLDVRRQDEWDEHHLDGALHIPLDQLEQRAGELDAYRGTELIVYCRTGNRSSQACMLLDILGFKQPVNLRGGITAW